VTTNGALAATALTAAGIHRRARDAVWRWVKRQRPYLLVALGSTLVVSSWFRTGTFIATGDMGPFIRQGWAPEAIWSWNHSITGAGSASYNIARGAEFVLLAFWKAIGLDEYAAQWSWYTLIYGLVGFGTAYAARAFVRSELAVVTAGMFGVLNGFFLARLPNPLNILSVASIALMTGLAIRVAKGHSIPPPVAGLVLLPTSFLGFNPPMLVVAYAWAVGGTTILTLLALGWRPLARLLWWFVKAVPWVVLLNAWWLVPLAQGFTGGGGAVANADFTDPTNWIWAQINNTIPNILTLSAIWGWYRPQYLPFAQALDQPYWVWLRYLLPALVLCAPLVALRRVRRVSLVLLAVSSVFVFLAKGLMPPLEQVNLWLYLHAPGFWLFREPMSKLGQVLVIFFAISLAILVEGLVARARARPAIGTRIALAAGFAGIFGTLLYPYPLYTGTVMPDDRPLQPSAHVRVPDFWWNMASTIDADPRPGKVLVLPLADYYQMPTTWGFFGVDSIANLLISHPVITPKPDGYFGDVPGFNANVRQAEAALLAGDLAAVPRLLDALQVAKVIVRHDLVRGLPGRSFADDATLDAALARVPGMTKRVTGPLDLWYVGDGTKPTVRTYRRLLDAPYRPEAGANAIATLNSNEAIRLQSPPKAVPGPRVVDDSAAVSNDVVQWPVPAVDEGYPSTSITTVGGTFTVAQRARSSPALVPSVDVPASELVLRDPTRVTVDGATVSTRPDLRIPLRSTDAVAVTAGTRTVSLDGWGGDALARATGTMRNPVTVVVGSGTPLTVWGPSAEPARTTPFSEVYDCNNYEPRPAAELGLRRDIVRTGKGTVVRLTAKDHAACTRVTVSDAKPGRTYRIRLEYRSVKGKRPQICIWQVGTDGCTFGPAPVIRKTWTPLEAFVTMDDAATGLQVILHSDVGQRLLGPTVSEYRGLRVMALAERVKTTVFPPEVPQTKITLAAGEHTLAVEGGLSGTVLTPFEPLRDCFNYDDLTPDQAGLFAEPLTEEPQPAFRIGARVHMACVGATAPAVGGTSLYELSFDARSVAVRDPKVCLFERGPDRCRSLPATKWGNEWQPYGILVSPDPSAVETRLYLYGLRDFAGKERSEVQYRAVRLRPVASTSSVVLVRDGPLEPAAELEWQRDNPTRFPVSVSGPTTVLSLSETYAPGWQLQGMPVGSPKPEHLQVQGWANGWTLPAGDIDGALAYGPSRISRYALLAFPVALVLALLYPLFAWWWRRRRVRMVAAREGAATDPELST
jgi:arabinofuranan 3-O-arabinosyltransferase